MIKELKRRHDVHIQPHREWNKGSPAFGDVYEAKGSLCFLGDVVQRAQARGLYANWMAIVILAARSKNYSGTVLSRRRKSIPRYPMTLAATWCGSRAWNVVAERSFGNRYDPLMQVTWAVLAASLLLTVGCSRGDVDDRPEAVVRGAELCQTKVLERLESPNTAKFEWDEPYRAGSMDRWAVEGVVESKKGFGALSRDDVLCVLKTSEDGELLARADEP